MNYITINRLFGSGSSQYFAPINLNQFFLSRQAYIPSVKDPQYIDSELKNLRIHTFGGYGENRKDIWKGTYLDKTQGYIHLGVDLNVPAGIKVRSPEDAEVIDVFTDSDTKIGWGGRVILQTRHKAPFIIFAHLDPESIKIEKGDWIKSGQCLGKIGTWPSNGNTFEHLHIQLRLTADFDTMDGYGYEQDLMNNPCPFTTKIY